MEWRGPTTQKLFAANATSIYDVSSAGAVGAAAAWSAVADFAARHGITVVSDEIWSDLLLDEVEQFTALMADKGLPEEDPEVADARAQARVVDDGAGGQRHALIQDTFAGLTDVV